MTFRGKIFLFISIFLLFVIGLVLAITFRSSKQTTTNNTPVNQPVATQNTVAPIVVPQLPPTRQLTKTEITAANKEALIQVTVKNFVERFGSYSPEANFSNFAEIKSMITNPVADWLKTYPDYLKKQQASDFLGITTRVLSQKITSSSDTAAVVVASTQRAEMRSSGNQVTYKDMQVKLVWSNGAWLVDGAYWQ